MSKQLLVSTQVLNFSLVDVKTSVCLPEKLGIFTADFGQKSKTIFGSQPKTLSLKWQTSHFQPNNENVGFGWTFLVFPTEVIFFLGQKFSMR